ncbi:MAG: STAS domain-containing protein [Deferribacterales bacterium]
MRTMEVENQEKVVIKVEGDMTVQHTGELHRILLAYLEQNKDVEIEFGDIEDADMTFMQLLCSAHRTFNAKDRHLTVSGKKNDLLNMKKLAGFVRHRGCSRDKFMNCILVKEK